MLQYGEDATRSLRVHSSALLRSATIADTLLLGPVNLTGSGDLADEVVARLSI